MRRHKSLGSLRLKLDVDGSTPSGRGGDGGDGGDLGVLASPIVTSRSRARSMVSGTAGVTARSYISRLSTARKTGRDTGRSGASGMPPRLGLTGMSRSMAHVRTSRTGTVPLETGLRSELDQTGVTRSLLEPSKHVLGYTGHQPGLLGLGQEVFTETAPVMERMLNQMSTNLTYQLHPVPMSRGSVSWFATTAKDIAKAGAVPRKTVRDHEHFRSSSEFSRYVDECIKRHLDPLGTGH